MTVTAEEIVSRVVICDSVSDELQKLRLVFTFLSQISDTSHEEGANFIGNWNTKYFDSALMTLGDTIDNIERIINSDA